MSGTCAGALVTTLIEHEVLWSRKQELDEFSRGLDTLGLLEIMRRNPVAAKGLMCFDAEKEFGPQEFEQCLHHVPPDVNDFAKTQAYSFFDQYIKDNTVSPSYPGGCKLKALLLFCTSYPLPPPGGLPKKITLSYLSDDDQYQLPTSAACFGYLRLPTVHSSQSKFNEMMDKALQYESLGFSAF